jgi:hypothetical protein
MRPKTTVPFVAKRPTGPEPWQEFGCTEAEYNEWVPHVCGIACTRSLILGGYGWAPSLWELTAQAIELGVFKRCSGDRIYGAYHLPLVQLLAKYGIKAFAFERLNNSDVWALCERGALILSIDIQKVEPALVGSHLVLVVGRTSGYALIHDNAHLISISGEACCVSHSSFDLFSNRRGLFIPWGEPSLIVERALPSKYMITPYPDSAFLAPYLPT